MSSIEHRTSARFEVARGWTTTNSGEPTILVVEDDPNSLGALKTILLDKGYQVLEACDGKQAIEVAEIEKLDLVLLDLELPKLDGLGVLRRLRANVALETLPVVVMTGCDARKARGNAIAAGCNDFLPKPIDFDQLEAVLDDFAPLPRIL